MDSKAYTIWTRIRPFLEVIELTLDSIWASSPLSWVLSRNFDKGHFARTIFKLAVGRTALVFVLRRKALSRSPNDECSHRLDGRKTSSLRSMTCRPTMATLIPEQTTMGTRRRLFAKSYTTYPRLYLSLSDRHNGTYPFPGHRFLIFHDLSLLSRLTRTHLLTMCLQGLSDSLLSLEGAMANEPWYSRYPGDMCSLCTRSCRSDLDKSSGAILDAIRVVSSWISGDQLVAPSMTNR